MYGITLNTTASPYWFNKSGSMINKEAEISQVSSARKVVIYNDSTSIYFSLGNIMVDGQIIDFIKLSEGSQINNWEEFKNYLITEPFTLNEKSELSFNTTAGSSDSIKAIRWLVNDSKINFTVELIEDRTSKLIGTLSTMSLCKSTVQRNIITSFDVKNQGIGEITVRLRIIPENNLKGKYSLIQHYTDNYGLLKENLQEITYKGNTTVKEYGLSQNYPNPFNPSTVINYQLPEPGHVTLKIYDAIGNEVTTLVNEFKSTGKYSIEFNARNLSSGLYFYELRAGNFMVSKKMLMIK